jgi:hypothetical protein
MNSLIGGLTPREHFRMHGEVPGHVIERMFDQIELLSDLAGLVTELSHDLSSQAYSNPDAYDLNRVRSLLKILREVNQ